MTLLPEWSAASPPYAGCLVSRFATDRDRSMSFFRNELRRIAGLAAIGSLLLVLGCGQQDQITSYTVRKPELVDPTLAAKPTASIAAAADNQTLGLIVPV